MEAKDQASSNKYVADISSIKAAQERIVLYAHKTPVLSSETLNSETYTLNVNVFRKGAFKFRGACNAVFSLTDDQAAKGVITHSSGNHAAALALAAKLRGIPKNAPKCKVDNVIRYGGKVIWSGANMQSREEVAAKVLEDTGAVLIHPYNDARIISGQGTISLELLEQIPHIDAIIVPINGVALAAKSINPAIRILAAEPKGTDDAARSKKAVTIVTLPETNTIADGLRASLGSLTWPVVRDLVDDIIVVDDKEIIEATRLCYEILKVAVELSALLLFFPAVSVVGKSARMWELYFQEAILI